MKYYNGIVFKGYVNNVSSSVLSGGEYDNLAKKISKAIKIADDNVVQFYYVPQISRYINRRFDLYNMGPVAIMTLRLNPLKRLINRFLKRSFDLLFSSIVLIFSPIIL